MARTEIEETFRNDDDVELEGIYRFPMPPDARIASLLEGKVGGAHFEQRYPVQLIASDAAGNVFVPRTWAAKTIESLELEGRVESAPHILALSKAYGVMSRQTSLLVLESEAMFPALGVERAAPTLEWTGEETADEGHADALLPAERRESLAVAVPQPRRSRQPTQTNVTATAASTGRTPPPRSLRRRLVLRRRLDRGSSRRGTTTPRGRWTVGRRPPARPSTGHRATSRLRSSLQQPRRSWSPRRYLGGTADAGCARCGSARQMSREPSRSMSAFAKRRGRLSLRLASRQTAVIGTATRSARSVAPGTSRAPRRYRAHGLRVTAWTPRR